MKYSSSLAPSIVIALFASFSCRSSSAFQIKTRSGTAGSTNSRPTHSLVPAPRDLIRSQSPRPHLSFLLAQDENSPDESTSSSSSAPKSNDDEDGGKDVSQNLSSITAPPSTPPRAPRRLDPLVASLTRMDEDTKNVPTKKLPLLGEVTMDRSLFVFVPVAAFAVIGILTSLYVAMNASGDIFVQAAEAVNDSIMAPKPVPDPNVCRGLCSTQEQDLEGLKTFMNALRN